MFKKIVSVVLSGVFLASCGLARMQERKEQMAAAVAQKDARMVSCKEQFPDETKNFVQRYKCKHEAANIVRPFANYPDLFDQLWARGGVLAEQLDARKITRAEADAQLAQISSDIVAEEQRRNLANRSVGAQESMAAASWAGAYSTPVVVNVRR
jgi:hypothetical protein